MLYHNLSVFTGPIPTTTKAALDIPQFTIILYAKSVPSINKTAQYFPQFRRFPEFFGHTFLLEIQQFLD